VNEFVRIGLIAIVAVLLAKMFLPKVPGLAGVASHL
jgi:hypothetical protein